MIFGAVASSARSYRRKVLPVVGVGNCGGVVVEGEDEGDLAVAQAGIAAADGAAKGGDSEPEADGEADHPTVLTTGPVVQLTKGVRGGKGGCGVDQSARDTGGSSRRVDPETEQLRRLRLIAETTDRYDTAGMSVQFGHDPPGPGQLRSPERLVGGRFLIMGVPEDAG